MSKFFAKLPKLKNRQSEEKPIKIEKRPETTYCFGCKDFTHNFRPQEVKFILEMNLKQPGFTYSACGLFNKNKERIEKFMQTGNTHFIYRNELLKACFQHDMPYGKSKDLVQKTQ